MAGANEFYISLIAAAVVILGSVGLAQMHEWRLRRKRAEMEKVSASVDNFERQLMFLLNWIGVAKKESEFKIIAESIGNLEKVFWDQPGIDQEVKDLTELLKKQVASVASEKALGII